MGRVRVSLRSEKRGRRRRPPTPEEEALSAQRRAAASHRAGRVPLPMPGGMPRLPETRGRPPMSSLERDLRARRRVSDAMAAAFTEALGPRSRGMPTSRDHRVACLAVFTHVYKACQDSPTAKATAIKAATNSSGLAPATVLKIVEDFRTNLGILDEDTSQRGHG